MGNNPQTIELSSRVNNHQTATPASRQPLGGRLGKGGASHGSRGATIVRLLFFKGYPQGINIFEDDFPLPVWWDMGMFPREGSLRSSKCITKHIGKTEMLTKTGIQRGYSNMEL